MTKRRRIFYYLPFVVLLCYMIIVHIPIQFSADDLWFGDILNNQSYAEFLTSRYNTWSSRLIIEAALITLTHTNIIIWKVVDCLVYTGIAYVISRIVGDESIKGNWLSVIMCMLYPFSIMGTAGYVATTMNYTWPLFCLLGVVYYVKKSGICIDTSAKIRPVEYALWMIALIIAGNTEQGAAIIFGILVMYIVFRLIGKKKISKAIFASLIISIAQLVFIITCPGNAARKAAEAAAYMPDDYGEYSLFRLLDMGISSTFYNYIFCFDCIFLVLTIVVIIKGFEYTKESWKRAIVSIPFAITLIFTVVSNRTYKLFPNLGFLSESLTKKGTLDVSDARTIIPYLIYGMVAVSLLYFVYLVYKDDRVMAIEILMALIVGFGSRVMMSFSASIWESEERTFLYLEFAFVFVVLSLIRKINNVKSEKWVIYIIGIMAVLVVL